MDLLAALRHPVIALSGAGGQEMAEIGEDQIGRPGQQHRRQTSDHYRNAPYPPSALPQAQPAAAERDQHHPGGRQARHRPDIAGERLNPLRDDDRHIDAPAHRRQRQCLEAERHQQAGDKAPGQGPHRRDRHRDHIGQRRIQHEMMEVVDREGLGADRRDYRRHRDRAAIAQRLVAERTTVKQIS